MPANNVSKNSKRAAAGVIKSMRATLRAEPEAFMSVFRALGNGSFTLRNAKGKEVRVGRISKGLRISVGQIVVTEGNHDLGVEITGVIQDRFDAEQLVSKGKMPASVLAQATGDDATAELDDLFEAAPQAMSSAIEPTRGGRKAQREAEATQVAIQARLAQLMGDTAPGPAPAINVDDL